jgi:hypothetical protein
MIWPSKWRHLKGLKEAGGLVLAKTLRELRATPDWPTRYPEIYAGLQELLGKFRQTYQALAGSIVPVQLVIPQIAVPDVLLDLIAAAQRDRAAIARLSNQRSVLEQIPPELLVDAILWPARTAPSRPGRPVASYRFPNEEALLGWLAPHVNAILADGRYPSLTAVAGQMQVTEGTIRYHFKRFFDSWESVLSNFVRGN